MIHLCRFLLYALLVATAAFCAQLLIADTLYNLFWG